MYILSNCVSDSRNIPSLKLSAIFCHVLSIIFMYTQWVHTFPPLQLLWTSLASLLTMSWVKQACFQSIIKPKIQLYKIQHKYTKLPFLSASLITTRLISVHVRRVKHCKEWGRGDVCMIQIDYSSNSPLHFCLKVVYPWHRRLRKYCYSLAIIAWLLHVSFVDLQVLFLAVSLYLWF